MKKIILLLTLAICPVFMYAQKGFKHAEEGFKFEENGNYTKAIECYEKALKAEFYVNGLIYCRISSCYTEMSDNEKAFKYLEEGYRRFPNCLEIIDAIIVFKNENNQIDECLKLIDKRLSLEATPMWYYTKGIILYEIGKHDEALECYRKSEELAPDYGWGYYSIGVHYYGKLIEIQEKYEDTEMPESEVDRFDEIALTTIEYFEKAFNITTAQEVKLSAAEYLYGLGTAYQETDEYYKELAKKYKDYMENGIQL